MSGTNLYTWGVIAVFVVSLIPCWISTYEPIEHVFGFILGGRTLMENAFAIPILGTLKAAAIALCWPVVLPVAAVLWLRARNLT